jgi:hypothetical protein
VRVTHYAWNADDWPKIYRVFKEFGGIAAGIHRADSARRPRMKTRSKSQHA